MGFGLPVFYVKMTASFLVYETPLLQKVKKRVEKGSDVGYNGFKW